jgi:hypothetical protein
MRGDALMNQLVRKARCGVRFTNFVFVLCLITIGCVSSPPPAIFDPTPPSTENLVDARAVVLDVTEHNVLFEDGVSKSTSLPNLRVELDRAYIEFARLNQNRACFKVTLIVGATYNGISFSQSEIERVDNDLFVVGQPVPKLGCSSFRGVTYWFDKSSRNLLRTVFSR